MAGKIMMLAKLRMILTTLIFIEILISIKERLGLRVNKLSVYLQLYHRVNYKCVLLEDYLGSIGHHNPSQLDLSFY